jgi:methionine biosynthesis protein MetW
MEMIDDPWVNDNRRYNYSNCKEQFREEYPVIFDIVERGSSIIDMGCGNGSLLKLLIEKRGCTGLGFDVSETGIEACREKGLMAECRAIDQPHEDIADKQYDYAICNVTIQMVMYPEILLSEMKRIARYQIVSFPNFAYWRNRLDLLFRGRMPHPMLYGYKWYNTGHIHQLSIRDFEELIANHDMKTQDKLYFRGRIFSALNLNPNLFATAAIYLLTGQ